MSGELDQRLEDYGAAAEGRLAASRPGKWIGFAAATGAAAAGVGAIDAAIVHFDVNGSFSFPTTSIGTVLNLGSGYLLDFVNFNSNFGSIAMRTTGFGVARFATTSMPPGLSTNSWLRPLNTTQFVDTALLGLGNDRFGYFFDISDGGYGPIGPNTSTTLTATNFAGFQGPAGNFGWLRLRIEAGTTLTIIDFAFEDTGAPIQVGAIPEPSSLATGSLGLLALGAAGVSHYRKKKAEGQTAPA